MVGRYVDVMEMMYVVVDIVVVRVGVIICSELLVIVMLVILVCV